MDKGHLQPYLTALRQQLAAKGFKVAEQNIVIKNGRVRAGYRVGEILFGAEQSDGSAPRAVIHVIGERPGTGHHNFSAYIVAPSSDAWKQSRKAFGTGSMEGQVDHNMAKLVSGISDTAMKPAFAAGQTVTFLQQLIQQRR